MARFTQDGYGDEYNELTPQWNPNRKRAVPAVPAAASTTATTGGTLFDDPYTSLFEKLALGRIGSLSQPFNDPGFNDVVGLIRGQMGSMGPTSVNLPSVNLPNVSVPRVNAPAPVSFPEASFTTNNAYLPEAAAQIRQRIAELNAEPFSAQEEDRYRTRALSSVEANRTANLQRAKERASQRGIADTSGILLDEERNVDREAARNRTTAETDLAMFQTTERNRRRDLATQVAQVLAGMGETEAARELQASMAAEQLNQQGRISAAQLNQSGELNAAQLNQSGILGAAGLNQSGALGAASLRQSGELGLASLNTQRQGQVLQAAGMLADLAAQRRGEQRANQNDILQIAQSLASLQPQRMAQVLSVLSGSGSDIGSVMGGALNLSNTAGNANQVASQGNQAFQLGLGQLLAYLASGGKE